LRPERLAVQKDAFPAARDPLLAGAEVVDERETDVVHHVAVRDCDREREERDPALRVQRAVDRVDDDALAPAAAHADLLRHDRRIEPVEASEDDTLRRRVDRGSVVAPFALREHRLALRAGRQLGEHRAHVLGRRAREREPVSRQARRRAGRW
jgi:hypothetical protein